LVASSANLSLYVGDASRSLFFVLIALISFITLVSFEVIIIDFLITAILALEFSLQSSELGLGHVLEVILVHVSSSASAFLAGAAALAGCC